MNIRFTLNGSPVSVETDADKPLLWVLREDLQMTGTKFGCGRALCGACTLHVDGEAVRACVFPAKFANGKTVGTIEGIDASPVGQAVVSAWIEKNVVQCGWCQPGQCMSAAALLQEDSAPSDEAIDGAMSGNLCRCGTYPRIREAIKRASGILGKEASR
ncbi:MAG: (2Fe-2S)-binding protein [Phycisphaerae bacterium]